MTADEAKAAGYEVIKASAFEVGLVKNGVGLRTWWSQDFDRKLPDLSHPLILECIERTEKTLGDYLNPTPVCCERCRKLTRDAGVLESPHNFTIHDTSCDPPVDRYWICTECFPGILNFVRFGGTQP